MDYLKFKDLKAEVLLCEWIKGFSNITGPGQISTLSCSKWDVSLAKDNEWNSVLTKRLVVLTTPGSASPAYVYLARWCWIAEKRHCHQRLNRMSTIIMAPLCSIYIFNILRAFKCWLTGWLQICCAYVKIHITSCHLEDQDTPTLCWQVKSAV